MLTPLKSLSTWGLTTQEKFMCHLNVCLPLLKIDEVLLVSPLEWFWEHFRWRLWAANVPHGSL